MGRVNAWMDNYRVLVVRYERTASHCLSYCQMSGFLMCLRRLTLSLGVTDHSGIGIHPIPLN